MKATKRVSIIITIFLLSGLTNLFAGCSMPAGKGPDNVIKETRKVSDFTGIRVGGAFEVFITQTGSSSLVIEADEEIMEYITTEVSGGILKIGLKKAPPKCWDNVKTLNAYITVDDLKSLDLSGAVELTTENKIKGDEMEIEISGAVEADLNLELQELAMELSGASEVDIIGEAKDVEIKSSGASDINTYDFDVENLAIYSSGASDAKVSASGTLKVSASGACDVRYKGGASVNVHTSGASSVKKID